MQSDQQIRPQPSQHSSPQPSQRDQVKQFNRLLCYYGDDFTGSTDVLEALFQAGLRTVLFLDPPSQELLQEQFQDVECFGVAGIGRSLSPEEMEQELRPIFTTLKSTGAAIFHYKICSTFDSSPSIGNIGKAAEIGRDVFEGRYIPLLVGVPYLKRYTLFGQHYAGTSHEIYRLDRHPTMSQHPVTPMAEADLCKHLEQQTKLRISTINILELDGTPPAVQERLAHILQEEHPDVLLFDVLDDQRMEVAGRMIWEEAKTSDGLFVIGSSGIEYALSACWRSEGMLAAVDKPVDIVAEVEGRDKGRNKGRNEDEIVSEVKAEVEVGIDDVVFSKTLGEVDQLLVVSGSCSPITEGQIKSSLDVGFVGIRVPMDQLLDPKLAEAALLQLRTEVQAQLENGRSVVVYSASGPSDVSIGLNRDVLMKQGLKAEDSGRLLGMALGKMTKDLIATMGLHRIVIAGGDTSGYITRELGIYALECLQTIDPGGPLCRAFSHDERFDGLQIVLKGGQVGSERFFEKVRRGDMGQ